MIPEIERLTKENNDLRALFGAMYQLAGNLLGELMLPDDDFLVTDEDRMMWCLLDALSDPDDAIARKQHECRVSEMTPRQQDEDGEELDDGYRS